MQLELQLNSSGFNDSIDEKKVLRLKKSRNFILDVCTINVKEQLESDENGNSGRLETQGLITY
jgi:hypothetical protein